jgi:hypothetical protein
MTRVLRGDHCQCRGCGEYFNSTYAFDMHRTGEYTHEPPKDGRRCLTPDEMHAKGMTENAGGWWISARSSWTGDSVGRDRPEDDAEAAPVTDIAGVRGVSVTGRRDCLACGYPLRAQRSTAQYCSTRCRVRSHREGARQWPPQSRTRQIRERGVTDAT